MPARSRGLALLLAGLALGCSRNPAPSGWLPAPRAAQSDPYGAWILLIPHAGPDVAGEFLAVDGDSVFVLLPDGEVRAVPTDSVWQAKIAFFDSQWSGLAAWTFVGALSTISNGAFLIFTYPLWTIGGSLITGGQSRSPIRQVREPTDWDAVRMFARFPAGLPAGLPRRLPTKPPSR